MTSGPRRGCLKPTFPDRIPILSSRKTAFNLILQLRQTHISWFSSWREMLRYIIAPQAVMGVTWRSIVEVSLPWWWDRYVIPKRRLFRTVLFRVIHILRSSNQRIKKRNFLVLSEMSKTGLLLLAVVLVLFVLSHDTDAQEDSCYIFIKKVYNPCIRLAQRAKLGHEDWKTNCRVMRRMLTKWAVCNQVYRLQGCPSKHIKSTKRLIKRMMFDCGRPTTPVPEVTFAVTS